MTLLFNAGCSQWLVFQVDVSMAILFQGIFIFQCILIYKTTQEQYKKLLKDNITKTYTNLQTFKKSQLTWKSSRLDHLLINPAFITLKNTKENFNLKLPYHLINPSKSELGKVSKHKLEKTNKILVQHLNANQWKNSTNVMKFFSALENKNNYPFIKFDIQEFYPSITDGILKTSLLFVNEYQDIPGESIR